VVTPPCKHGFSVSDLPAPPEVFLHFPSFNLAANLTSCVLVPDQGSVTVSGSRAGRRRCMPGVVGAAVGCMLGGILCVCTRELEPRSARSWSCSCGPGMLARHRCHHRSTR
jgi:hypothetical protein